ADLTDDAAGDQHRTPVPPEVAGHLANRVVGQVVAGHRHRPEHGLVLAGGAQRGGEADLEVVAALEERVGDVETPGAVLVLHLGGGGVKGGGDQVDACGAGGGPVEAGGVGDVAFAGPGQLVLVPVQVGVGDQSVGVQVGDQGAGHGGGHVAGGERGRTVGDGQVPALVQRTTGQGGGAGRGHGRASARAR